MKLRCWFESLFACQRHCCEYYRIYLRWYNGRERFLEHAEYHAKVEVLRMLQAAWAQWYKETGSWDSFPRTQTTEALERLLCV